ncbi:MAG: hypothetical protein ACI835_003591 [Planctomycetota bacterium]|jgi:hypothetical protein
MSAYSFLADKLRASTEPTPANSGDTEWLPQPDYCYPRVRYDRRTLPSAT